MREAIALAMLAPCAAAPAWAAKPHRFVACVPDAPGSTRAARPYMERLHRALEAAMRWEKGTLTGLFTPRRKVCLRELKRKRTSVALLSMDLYLPWRRRFRLRPLAIAEVGGVTTTRYHVVVKKGSAGSLGELAGARWYTNHGADRRVLARVLLGGKLGREVEVRRTPRPLKALRAVHAGRERATLVDDGELEKMKALPFADELAPIHSSGPIPNPVVVAVGKRGGQDVDALVEKLLGLCAGEAKSVCESLRLSGFARPDEALMRAVTEQYGK